MYVMPRARELVATFCGYLTVVVWLTWPLAATLGTALPHVSAVAEMDALHALWVLSWESHALATDPGRFLDANIYHPLQGALLYSTLGLATLPFFAPVFLLSGNPVLAGNVVLLLCSALGAWGLHCVIVWWTGSRAAGVIAAAAFLLTPWVLWSWTPPRPIHAPLQWLPWIVALVALPGWRLRRGVVLLPLVVLQCLVDPIYVAPAIVLPIAIVGCFRLLRPATRRGGLGLLATVALAAAVLSPLYAGYATMRAANPSLSQQSAWARPAGAPTSDLTDGFVLAGGAWADLRPTGVPLVVLPLIGLGAVLLVGRRRVAGDVVPWLHAGLWVTVGLVVSTRSLVWLGDPPLVLRSPVFALLDATAPAVATMLRGTVRLGIAALVGLALLAGLAFAECRRRLPGRVPAALATVALLVAMYVRWPGAGAAYPIAPAPAPDTPIVAALRQGTGPVLELPAGIGPYETTQHARAMYRSIFHWRPLLNGYGSYWPVGFPERLALARQLPDPAAWDALRRETGVDAVVVHPDAAQYQDWLALAARPAAPLRLAARDGDVLLFVPR